MTDEAWTAIRWTSACLSMTAAALLIASYMWRVNTMSARLRRIVPWFIVLLVVITYGCGEAASSHVDGGVRVVLLPLALLGLVGSMLIGFRSED